MCVCDCGALQKVCLTFQRLQHVCVARKGCCQGVKVTFFAAGSRLNRLQVTVVLPEGASRPLYFLEVCCAEKPAFVLEVCHVRACLRAAL